ncbi:MAG: NAD(P)H-hydrate dehydratase [Firmicutes bacterium]|nr:NAD(P)H-hydrate dehydratase [Bacillota bacterium]
MKPILSVRQVRLSESAAIENGLGEDILIENSAATIFAAAARVAPPTVEIAAKTRKTRVLVLVCGGNNGADGFSAARLLHLAGYDVQILSMKENFNTYAKDRRAAAYYLNMSLRSYSGSLPDCDILIDAMIGIGLGKSLDETYRKLVEQINAHPCYKIAVDIPTGINADTGCVMGAAVKADETVTFSFGKYGHFSPEASEYTGKLTIAEIGLRAPQDAKAFLLEEGDHTPEPRRRASHKYDHGFVKIIAGSGEMPGAAALALTAASAALKSGAGLCSLCVPDSLKDAYRLHQNETMYQFLSDRHGKILYDEPELDAVIQKADAILLGPGLGKNPDIAKIIRYICQNFDGTLVLDADGLNALAEHPECVKDRRCSLILTPHAGEFNRLTQNFSFRSPKLMNRVIEYADAMGACVLYKSHVHIIAHLGKAYVNSALTPALAKGGSGDVLAGLVAAMAAKQCAARNKSDAEAASHDGYGPIHGSSAYAAASASLSYATAAIKAAAETGVEALLPSDMIRFI